jgi:hypothetical protein
MMTFGVITQSTFQKGYGLLGWIHNPWDLPDAEATRAGVRLGSTYAERVVIHAERRPLALAMYGATRL